MSDQFDLDRFDNSPNKRWIQSRLYDTVGRYMTSDVMMVSGPEIKQHITDGFKVASNSTSKIFIVENKDKVFNEILRRYQTLKNEPIHDGWSYNWTDRVTPVRADVISYLDACKITRPVRFEDLDLCQTMSSIRYIVGHRLLNQSKLAGKARKSKKCMLITSSLRRCSLEKTVDILSQIFKDVLDAETSDMQQVVAYKQYKANNNHWVREYINGSDENGRIVKNGIHFYTYKDIAPMFSCMVVYI